MYWPAGTTGETFSTTSRPCRAPGAYDLLAEMAWSRFWSVELQEVPRVDDTWVRVEIELPGEVAVVPLTICLSMSKVSVSPWALCIRRQGRP